MPQGGSAARLGQHVSRNIGRYGKGGLAVVGGAVLAKPAGRMAGRSSVKKDDPHYDMNYRSGRSQFHQRRRGFRTESVERIAPIAAAGIGGAVIAKKFMSGKGEGRFKQRQSGVQKGYEDEYRRFYKGRRRESDEILTELVGPTAALVRRAAASGAKRPKALSPSGIPARRGRSGGKSIGGPRVVQGTGRVIPDKPNAITRRQSSSGGAITRPGIKSQRPKSGGPGINRFNLFSGRGGPKSSGGSDTPRRGMSRPKFKLSGKAKLGLAAAGAVGTYGMYKANKEVYKKVTEQDLPNGLLDHLIEVHPISFIKSAGGGKLGEGSSLGHSRLGCCRYSNGRAHCQKGCQGKENSPSRQGVSPLQSGGRIRRAGGFAGRHAGKIDTAMLGGTIGGGLYYKSRDARDKKLASKVTGGRIDRSKM